MLAIPRTFHRVWLGTRPMPREFVDFGNSWLAHHPGWTMHTWTDSWASWLSNRDAFKKSAAQSGKANILRYEILLRYGGVYVDTDFECLKNIEPLLQNVTCFVGLQSPELANNAIIGSIAGHPFLRDLVHNIPARMKVAPPLSIKQSGPYYLTERLRGRRDVTVYPPALFYPYQWHERWRRHEVFPLAYGVHHWALSWRKGSKSKPCSIAPRASVVLVHTSGNLLRLQWALEGLCEQTAVGTFEVLVVDSTQQNTVLQLVSNYAGRLRIGYRASYPAQRGLLSEEVRRYVSTCHSPRVILLDSQCVPDRELVGSHARLSDSAVVGYSRQRLYPSQKIYPFAPPLDYDSLKIHSIPDRRYTPSNAGWRDIPEACISMPKSALAQLRIPADLGLREGGRWLARELNSRDFKLTATSGRTFVTRLL